MRKHVSHDAVGAGMFGISGGFLMTPLMVFIGVQLGRRISVPCGAHRVMLNVDLELRIPAGASASRMDRVPSTRPASITGRSESNSFLSVPVPLAC